jgi:hypothetical protein
VKEFRELISEVKSQFKPVIGKVNGLIMDDRELDWTGVNADLVDVSPLTLLGRKANVKDDFVSGVGRKISQARIEVLEKLKSLLEGL